MRQITILSEEKKDLITDITGMLADAKIEIESITGRNYGQRAIVTVTVNDFEKAMQVISLNNDLDIMSEDALIVRIEDELGSLAKLSQRFSNAGIDIRSIRFIERCDGYALVAISTERTDKALELVKDIIAG